MYVQKILLCVSSLLVVFGASRLLAAEQEGITVYGYAAPEAKAPLTPYAFKVRNVGDNDVLIDLLYAGVCHSDIHMVDGDWGPFTAYPFVPGHEMIGKISAVGGNVEKFKVGDIAGVGGLADSCGECEYCLADQEQYCVKGATFIHGGYAAKIVVDEKYALTIPEGVPLERAAPLLCAGITAYSPLKALKVKEGDEIAVAGLGGVGHMALQYAVSMGAKVTVFEATNAKAETAKKLGAVDYVNTHENPEALKRFQGRFTAVISTIPVGYNIQPYVNALKSLGTLVILGMPPADQSGATFDLNTLSLRGRTIMGSAIGGRKETREMLNYSAARKIYPEVEVIPAEKVNAAFQRVKEGDVQFRFVLDLSTIEQP
jgi:uncharacterized zinc-type alcohol dehydrogenase-like protein